MVAPVSEMLEITRFAGVRGLSFLQEQRMIAQAVKMHANKGLGNIGANVILFMGPGNLCRVQWKFRHLATTFPIRWSSGTKPQYRESWEPWRLSPVTQ